jgi:hypothetical protein
MRTVMLVLSLAAVGLAQTSKTDDKAPKKAEKSELERLLESALRSHPDIRTAEARLLLARADLEKARMETAHKVALAYMEVQVKREKLTEARRRLIVQEVLHKRGGSPESDLIEAQAAVSRLSSEVRAGEEALAILAASPDAAWRSLVDKASEAREPRVPGLGGKGDVRPGPGKPPTSPDKTFPISEEITQRLRKALALKVSVKLDGANLDDVIDSLKRDAKIYIKTPGEGYKVAVSTPSEELSFGAVCQLIEDSVFLRFVVREYGLILIPEDYIPPGSVTLMELWKAGPSASSGMMKIVTIEGHGMGESYVKISAGRDDGLAPGDVLDVASPRRPDRPFGKVKISSVTSSTARGAFTGAAGQEVAVGDILIRPAPKGGKGPREEKKP